MFIPHTQFSLYGTCDDSYSANCRTHSGNFGGLVQQTLGDELRLAVAYVRRRGQVLNWSLGNWAGAFPSTYGGDARNEQHECAVNRIRGQDGEVTHTRDRRFERGERPVEVDWPLAVYNIMI